MNSRERKKLETLRRRKDHLSVQLEKGLSIAAERELDALRWAIDIIENTYGV